MLTTFSPNLTNGRTGFDALTAEEIREAALAVPLTTELAAPAEYMLGMGGKRLRSAIVLNAARLGSRPDDPTVRMGAVAVELLHLATLAHDDIMDDGQLRRGRDTIGAIYGNITASLLGGALCARAAELMTDCGSVALSRFTMAACETCRGQMIEFEDLFDLSRSTERYSLAIAGKTAALFAFAGWLGASMAGATASLTETLAEFGYAFGMAFQIADDVLDLIAPDTVTGKIQAKDLERGIYTLPVIHAIKADRDLAAALRQTSCDANRLQLAERVAHTGGIKRATHESLAYSQRAKATLSEALDCHSDEYDILCALIDHALAPLTRRLKDTGL